MDASALAMSILGLRWDWSTDDADRLLGALGARYLRAEGDRLLYVRDTLCFAVRQDRPGVVGSIALTLCHSDAPDTLDEAAWDAAVDHFDALFLDLARSVEAAAGPPSFHGLLPRGAAWDTWPTRVALWAQPTVPCTAWLSVQLRQDDTDAPIEVALVWTPPRRVALKLSPESLPPPRPSAPPEREPGVEGLLREQQGMAVNLASEGRLDEALAMLEEVTAAAPFFAAAWNDRAIVHSMRGDVDEALECFDVALQEDPQTLSTVVANRIIVLKKAGRLRERYEWLCEAANAATATAPELYELAQVLHAQGQGPTARQVLERFLTRATPEYGAIVDQVRTYLARS